MTPNRQRIGSLLRHRKRIAAVDPRVRRPGALVLVLVLVSFGLQVIDSLPAAAAASCTPFNPYNNCRVFSPTGANQTFTVPKGITSINGAMFGANGGASTFDGPTGGKGGFASGNFAVTSGQVLNVTVGQSTGPFGGGGNPGGGGSRGTGGRGGGLSAVWTGAPFTGTPLLLAGGGGGAAGAGGPNPAGGSGGGSSGTGGAATAGAQFGGGGGTQTQGGTGGSTGGTAGSQFQGGNGSDGADSGGGGGGGWYGGGGGHGQVTTNDANNDGGGGGGSGYLDTTRVTGGGMTVGSTLATANGSVVLNWIAPAPTITSPAQESTVVDLTPTVTGTGVPSTNLSLKFNGTTVICAEGAPVVVAAGGGWTCTPTQDQPVGTTTVIATQSDPASPSATYPASAADTFTIAAPPPAAPVITGPVEGAYLSDSTPDLSGTGTAGATVTVKDGNGNTLCSPAPVVLGNGTWSCTVTGALPDGPASFIAQQTNSGGTSPASTTVHVTIDTAAPAAPTIASLPARTNDNTPTLTGTGEPFATVTVRDGNGVSVCAPAPVVAPNGTWTCTPQTALPDGAITFTPRQTDRAGNISTAGTPAGTVIDTSAPDAPQITGPLDGSYLNDNTPTLTGTGEIGATITIKDSGGNTICSPLPVVKIDGTWNCEPATALPDGPYAVTPTQADQAGNVSPPGTTVDFTIDTVVDVPEITDPAEGSYLSDNTPTITGTGEVGAYVSVTDQNGQVICIPTPIVQADGTWNCTVEEALPEGPNSFTPTQTDLAGNVSDAGATVHVVIDTVSPDAPVITAPTEGAYLTTTTPTIGGTGEPGDTVTVIDSGGNSLCLPLPVVQDNGNWTCTVATALPQGANSFTPTQTDLAGNVSDPGTTVNVVVDTVADPPVITAPAEGSYLSDNTPTISGTGEAGAVVTVLDADGNTVCTPLPLVQENGSWSCTVASALADGANSFTPTQTDVAGNVSAAGPTVHVVIDTVVAVPVITYPTDGSALANNTPSINGTGEAGATVTVLDADGNSVCSPLPVVQEDGTWSCTVASALPEGANSFTPTQTDLAGNVSDAGTTVHVVIDTTAPDAPVITGPTEGAYLSDNTPTITGSGEVGATVTVLDSDGNSVCSPLPVVQEDGTWSCTVATALPDGPHAFTPTQQDLAGNVSDAGTTVNVTIDTVVYAPVITAPTEGAYLSTNTPVISGTGEVGATVTVVDSGGNRVCSPLPVVQEDGSWSCTVATALPDGANSFTPTQTDLAGNVSAAGPTVHVVVDTAAPGAPVITGPTEGAHLPSNTPDLTGTGEPGATVTVLDSGGNSVCTPLPVVQPDGSWTCTVATALPEGAASFTPTQTDLAGNVSAAGTTVTVTIDTTPPDAPVITGPTEGAYLSDNTPTLTGTGEPGATVKIVDSGGNSVCSPRPVVQPNGSWTCTVATALPDGPNSFTPTQTDLADNESAAGTTVHVTIDTVVEVPVITGPAEGAYLSDNTPTITGTGEVGAYVSVTDQNGQVICIPTPIVQADGTWNCTVEEALPEGPNSFTPTQTDLAGNVSDAGTTVTVTIDTVVDTPVITAPTEGAYLSDNTPTITGTGEPGATVTVLDAGGNSVCTPLPVVQPDGSWTCTVATALPEGAASFTPTQTDLAGNVSTAGTTVTVTIDTVVDAPVITAPTEGAYLSDNTPTITGTGEPGATVTVLDAGGNSVCTPLPVVQPDGSWTCTVATALPEGAASFTPTQTDLAGNVSAAGTTVTVTIDTVVDAPVITAPTDGAYLSDNTPNLAGTGEVGATVTIVDSGGNSVCAPLPVVQPNGTWTCTVATALPDGPNSFTPTQTDLAGNVSAAGTTVTVTIDTVVDAPVITGPTDGAYLSDNTPTITGIGEVGATVTVLDAGGNSVCSPLPVVQPNGTWTCTVATALPEGAASFTPTQTDLAGNVSTAGTTVTITIDTVVDAPVITAPTDGAYLSDNTPTLAGTGEVGATVTIVDSGGNSVCAPLPVVQPNGTWTCMAATALPDGPNSFTPTQTDLAGNVSAAGTTVHVVVDTAAPAVPVITGPTEGAYLSDNTPDLAGTGEVGATVTIVDSGGNSVCAPLPVVQPNGTWTCTVATALPDGPNSFTPTQVDLAGNESAAGTTVHVTIDTVVAAPVITGPTEGSHLKDNTPTITGTGEVGATVTVLDSGGNSVCSPLPVVQPNGTWTCTVATALPEGSASFTPTQTDLAGNVSAVGTTVHVTIDTIVDAPVITAPTEGAYLSDNTPVLTGTGEPGATVTIVDSGGNSVCTPLPLVQPDGSWTCTVATPLPDGANSFTPTQTDLAGNISSAGPTVDVVVDTAVPALPVITGPADGSYLSDNTPVLTGTGEIGATVTVLDSGGNVVCLPRPVVQPDGTWTCTVSTPLPEGANSFTPTQTDRAGNVSAAGTRVAVTIDTLVDPPAITGPTTGAHLSDNTPTISGTGEIGSTIAVLDKDGNSVCAPPPLVGSNGRWSCTVVSALPDGPNSFTPTQVDPAGNISAPGDTIGVIVDTAAPGAPTINPLPAATTNHRVQLSGRGEPGATIVITDDAGSLVCATPALVASDGTWTCTPQAPLPDGEYEFTATQTDAAGNVSASSRVATTVIDTTGPGAPVITGPKDGTVIDDGNPNPPITGVGAAAGDTITVLDGGKTICTTTVQLDGSWSCLPATPFALGTHRLSVTETDPLGNVSAPSALLLTKRPVTDLSVTSTAGAGSITVGQQSTIVVTVGNTGLDDETMATVTDPIAGAIAFVSYRATAGSYDADTGVWTVGPLGAGQRQTLTLTIAGAAVGSAAVPFTVSGEVADTDASNDSSTVTFAVVAAPTTPAPTTPTTTATITATTPGTTTGVVVSTVTTGVIVTTVVDDRTGAGGLAYTGYDAALWTGLGSLLLLGGMLVIGASRRRRPGGGHHLG